MDHQKPAISSKVPWTGQYNKRVLSLVVLFATMFIIHKINVHTPEPGVNNVRIINDVMDRIS